MFGLITGSGLSEMPQLVGGSRTQVETPYGLAEITNGTWDGRPVALVPRHGPGHTVPPSGINYRANIWALRDSGVTQVLATAVSGGIDPALRVGDLVVISDFLDFTSGRATTFFDGSREPFDASRHHTDMTNPYDPALRVHLLDAGRAEGIDLVDGGVYAATNGPRFETPAEIHMMRALGADLVGMTGYPEVALAREVGLAYASIGVIANPAAGMANANGDVVELRTDDMFDLVGAVSEPLRRLISRAMVLAS